MKPERTGRNPELDAARLGLQRVRVRIYMLSRGGWETLEEICAGLRREWPGARFSSASISAELRNLCNPKQCQAEELCLREKRRRMGQEARGVWEYALYPVGPAASTVLEVMGQKRLFAAEL
jgi:hypothetical protein